MASVNSPIRTILKPLIYKMMPRSLYLYSQYLAKVKDIENKLVEEPELKILPFILKRDSNCIDIGANYAYITERLSSLCPGGTIYSFEPIPFTYRVAEKIVKKLRLGNVKLYQLGVGKENTEMTFEVPLQDFGAYSAGQAHVSGRKNEKLKEQGHYRFDKFESVRCQIIRLDDFKEIDKPIDFVKIDIEGAEFFAIEGMEALLLKFKPTIYMEVNPDFLVAFSLTEQDLREKMEFLGYRFFSFDGNLKLVKHDGPFVEANYFLIHTDKMTQHSEVIV